MAGVHYIKDCRFLLVAGWVLFWSLFTAPHTARAEYGRLPISSIDPEIIRIDEEKFLGVQLDGDYVLVDDSGREFRLGEFFGKPLVLLLSYYSCNGSCPITNTTLSDITSRMNGLARGSDYRVLTLSFDKNDGREEIKKFKKMTGLEGLTGKGWTVAIMKNKEDIKRLTGSIGYRFFWSRSDRLFIHPSVLVILTPKGRVSRYLYTASISERDLDLAIREAAVGGTGRSKIRDLSDLLLIACYSYNFKEGKYTINYPLFIAAGSFFIGVSLVVLTMVVFKNKKRQGGRPC